MFVLEIDTGNSAFGDTPQYEVARLLRKVADRLSYGSDNDDGTVLDANGNSVGSWELVTEATR
jgi:hypothetical protein